MLVLSWPAQAGQISNRIINLAELHSEELPVLSSTVSVTLQTRTKSIIEFLKYAPGASGTTDYEVTTTYYQDSSGSFIPISLPPPIGAQASLGSNAPIPLLPTTMFHVGETIFVKTTDRDQNLDPTVAETIIVTITDTKTGDSETLRLTEIGPNAGIFVGYIPTAAFSTSAAGNSLNGNLSVIEESSINAHYVDIFDGTDSSVDAALIDPYGMVFSTLDGMPVNGATVALYDMKTGKLANVFGDDGTSSYPATIVSGSTANDSSGKVYSFPLGTYRFPYIAPGTYRLAVTPPSGYTAPSTVTNDKIQQLPGAPFAIALPGSRGEVFTVDYGPVIQIDIPIDPVMDSIWLKKTAGKNVVSIGEFLSYEITLENGNTTSPLSSNVITDVLPPGFRYQKGSTRIDGMAAADPAISADGRTLTFSHGTLLPKTTLTIRYVVSVEAGARPGTATNTATVTTSPAVAVNTATATVQVQEPFMQSRSLIMGRVFVGACGDNPDDTKKGMEGIGIYLEDGTFVFTDKFGMFHFEGVRPGTHVVQLDLDSIPEGYRILPCERNSRFAGRAYSQFVDLQGGTMWRTDFYLGRPTLTEPAMEKAAEQTTGIGSAADAPAPSAPAEEPKSAPLITEPADRLVITPFKGEINLEMLSSQADEIIDFRLPLQANTVPLKHLRMTVVLPEGTGYIPGSSSFNGTPLPDPAITPDGLVYHLEDATDKWRKELHFRAKVDTGRKAGDLVTRATLKFDTDIATDIVTPEVTNILTLTKEEKILPLPLFVFHPHFPTFGDELSLGDKKELDALVAKLADKIVKRIDVTGHTDNVRIAPRSRGIHADNRALSLARARSVGRYLAAALSLPPEALILNGSGETQPVATNRTAAGRALNRRVEVKITALQRIEISDLKIVKERSGLEKLETTGAPRIETVEQPATLAPLILPGAEFAIQTAESGTEPLPSQPDQERMRSTPVPAASLNPQTVQQPDNREEHAELIAVRNDGIVHYRVRLKNIDKPFTGATVSLTIPDKLLYMAGTSRLAGQAVADPDVNGATVVYTVTDANLLQSLDLRLQALPEGDELPEQASSVVAVTIHDGPDAPRNTFHASAPLTDDMQPITSMDSPTAGVPTSAKTDAGSEQAAISEVAAMEKKKTADAEEFIERVIGTAASRKAAASTPAANGVSGAPGIVSPADGSVLTNQINAVRIILESGLKPRLLVDGKEVAADRIGFSMKDSKSGKTMYSFIGVDLGEPGNHTVELKGLDPFGIARFSATSKIIRAGDIATIRLVATDGNIADGKTPVRIRVQLLDRDGNPIQTNAELTLRGGDLIPPLGTEFSKTGSNGTVKVETDGSIFFQPVTTSGVYRFSLGYGQNLLIEGETYVKPKMRDWILVGIAEGTAGFNTLSGHMEKLKTTGTDEHLYDRERLALFAKGTIKGEWLLTMAYDSAKQRAGVSGNALFQTIDPNSYYTLYGDATAQGYEAASQRKLYLKIERDQFFALFGDYDTGLSITELSRYSRRMNGLKTEYRSKNFEVTAFGAETAQTFVREDDIRGDGTSGLYRLKRKNIVINSEKVVIETRDRFHSEVITASRTMGRFVDYTIDYDNGTIFFKSPVPSRDEQLNPVFIVVEYEITDAGSDALTYGGRVGTSLLDGRMKAGVTHVHEGHVSGDSNLYGVDAGVTLTPGTKLRAEVATTNNDRGAISNNGTAWLAELTHTDKNLDTKAYIREQSEDFGIGQQRGSESGTRKFGMEGTYRLNQQTTIGGQGYRQYTLITGAVRDFIESLATYNGKDFIARAGLRYVNDSLADGSNKTSVQGTIGASWKTLNDRLTLRADHEQSIFSNDNSDFPTRTTLGADYQVTKDTAVFAQEELTFGNATNSNTTRAGVKSTPWSGGTLSSAVVNDLRENSERTYATVGLAQKWQISQHWAVDGGLDHNETIRRKTGYQFNANVPPASGGEDFTAVSLGANFIEPKLAWSNRVEYRNSDLDDKWGIITGVVNEQGLNWGWTSRLQLLHSQSAGKSKTDADLRLGLAYRPPVTRWIVLDRLDLIASDDRTSGATTRGKRIINNLNANYRPDGRTQISLQYGAKYVLEKIDDNDYSGFTELLGFEGRYDLTSEWDIGLRGTQLHTWNVGQFTYSLGPSIGYNIMENAWISCGYNLFGYHDNDFSASSYTAQGPYVQFRFKFDQNSIKDGLKALNQNP
jgi:uncharacterized repeat protein (TIGR01451 family)